MTSSYQLSIDFSIWWLEDHYFYFFLIKTFQVSDNALRHSIKFNHILGCTKASISWHTCFKLEILIASQPTFLLMQDKGLWHQIWCRTKGFDTKVDAAQKQKNKINIGINTKQEKKIKPRNEYIWLLGICIKPLGKKKKQSNRYFINQAKVFLYWTLGPLNRVPKLCQWRKGNKKRRYFLTKHSRTFFVD